VTAETYARLARPVDTRGTIRRVRDWFFLRRVLREVNWLRQGVCAPREHAAIWDDLYGPYNWRPIVVAVRVLA
jgi:hypothetical protein